MTWDLKNGRLYDQNGIQAVNFVGSETYRTSQALYEGVKTLKGYKISEFTSHRLSLVILELSNELYSDLSQVTLTNDNSELPVI